MNECLIQTIEHLQTLDRGYKGGRGSNFVLNLCSFNNIEKFFFSLTDFCLDFTAVVILGGNFSEYVCLCDFIYLTFPSFLHHPQLVVAG